MSANPTTATCPDCSTPARITGQSFCDACGAFLRWDAQGDAITPTPRTEPEPPPSRSAFDDPRTMTITATPPGGVKATPPSVPAPSTTGAFGPPDASYAPPAPTAAPVTPPVEADTVPQPATPPDQSAARALLVPVPDSGPYPAQPPGGVLPGRPEAARPKVRDHHTPQQPAHGTPCPHCATPNAPLRHFCRSCATPLSPQNAPTAEGPYAGQRPKLQQGKGRWIARALVATAVVAAVVGGIFGGPPAARAVQDHFAKRVAVHPTAWKASHSSGGHDAKLAFDSYSNTWWGTGYAGDSAGQYLEATFGQPTDLLNLVITPGTSARTGQSVSQARPQEFDVVVTDSGGKIHTFHRRIDDGGVQRLDVRVRDAVSARLVLRSAYGAGPAKQVAIAELEYFGRSTS
ncbi:discoidin domain-containing protein [Streptomyces sp. NBC_01465]|uniref:discoidin domain-containing protein n=1 Tax=Streptomyces sp. NBC_01465 TaxID=2903878 RepID=UPI002E33975C|nr:zinc ribbon domain-containing protein [Streptomyces sp. NBC_01465]